MILKQSATLSTSDHPMSTSPPFRARWKRVSLPNKLTVICTAIIAGATAWYSLVAHRQWDAMKKQLTQMEGGSKQTATLITATQNLATAAKSQAESAAAQTTSMKALAERALSQATATNALAYQSKRAADISESQQASPWLGIERDSFRLQGPRYEWGGPNAPTIRFEAKFSVRNFGTVVQHCTSMPG